MVDSDTAGDSGDPSKKNQDSGLHERKDDESTDKHMLDDVELSTDAIAEAFEYIKKPILLACLSSISGTLLPNFQHRISFSLLHQKTRRSLYGAAACRFLLGVFGAPITPGITLATPVDAWFFSHGERLLATAHVVGNQVGTLTGIKSGKFKPYQIKPYQIKLALLDFKTWCIVVSIFAAGIPNGVISNFS
ncbi:hypothetical protein EW145_g2069 [Phellinidium pouzarii]|uniref:Uncharacterized protein n=1 Tax=Phellinidium pouzarii TaxID=167371 RepID=A0A4S4LC75_9AGAM|nr:hypothetical protein EW145_g2069 [Phellinidium pouzarii]